MKFDFFIVGFQKCGTTKLKSMLEKFPSVQIQAEEEMLAFFQQDKSLFDKEIKSYYSNIASHKKIGAKHVSAILSASYIQRLYDHSPDCKIVLSLRNPVQRAFSAYLYCRRMGWEDEINFKKALTKKSYLYTDEISRRNCDYLGQSDYVSHIRKLFDIFPREQVKILIYEKEFHSEHNLAKKVATFLQIDISDIEFPSDQGKKINSFAVPRFPILTKLLRRRLGILTKFKYLLPAPFTPLFRAMKDNIIKFNEIDGDRPVLDLETQDEMERYFSSQILELECLLSEDLTIWRRNSH